MRTSAENTCCFRQRAAVLAYGIVGALQKIAFVTFADNPVQNDGTVALTKENSIADCHNICWHQNVTLTSEFYSFTRLTCVLHAQLLADYSSISIIPAMAAHCTVGITVAHFHSTRTQRCHQTIHQANITINTHCQEKKGVLLLI